MLRPLLKVALALLGISIAAGVASALAAVNLKKNAPPRPEPDADEIDFVTVMDGAKLASTASAFRGGRVVCWYAGVDLDLRDATLDPAGARLEVRTAFGGTRIVIAPGVPVRVGGPAIFGGISNETGAAEATVEQPGLEIDGLTVFGGLQIVAAEPGVELAGWGDDDEAAGRSDADVATEPALQVEPDASSA